MRKILVHPGGTTWSGFLPGDARQVLKSEDDGPGLRFRQVGKELEFGVHQQAAAPLPERQCVFEHWPDQLKRRSFIRVDACEPFSSARGRWLAFIKTQRDCDARVSGLLRNR